MLPTQHLGISRPKYRITLYHICNCVPGFVFAISKYVLSSHGESFKLNTFDFILGVVQFILYLIGRYESSPPSALRWFLATDWGPWARTPRVSNRMHSGVVPDVTLSVPLLSGGSFLPINYSIHSLLDGENPRPDFTFNLASPHYAPMQIVENQPMPLDLEILGRETATYPPIYRLQIMSDDLPEWPISFEYDPETYREQTGEMLYYPGPISVEDVLAGIYRALHETRISRIDWARLDENKKGKVVRAFQARCANGPTTRRNDGVKKVDYLLDKTWFRGLIKTDNPEVLKLVVSSDPACFF